MKNLKVSAKLMVCVTISAVTAFVIALIGVIGMIDVRDDANAMFDHDLIAAECIAIMLEAFEQERVYMRDMYIYIDHPSVVQDNINKLNAAHTKGDAAVQKYLAAIEDMSLEGPFLEIGDILNPPSGPYYIAKERIKQAAAAGDAGSLLAALQESEVYVQSIERNFELLLDNREYSATYKIEHIDEQITVFNILMIIIMLIGVAFSVLFGRYVSALISKPLSTITGFMMQAGKTGDLTIRPEDVKNIESLKQRTDEVGNLSNSTAAFIMHVIKASEDLEMVSQGDLTVKLEVLSDRDKLGVALRHMVNTLNESFSDIVMASEQVNNGSRQIADGSQSLAQGSTQQASSIQQLSSSIQEIADNTKTNAEMAEKAASLSDVISSNAEKGNRQMDDMIDAVRDINAASQNISKVIKVIDDIAFQTNILALNAAVEAARAGQHGKGFAVVAEEVRNLAAKSAEAAKETGDMIQNSMEKAELGSRIASETAVSFTEIAEGINESSLLIEQIAKSSKEQSAGISQINIGIDQVARVVQQNSATTQESAAAAQEMSGQSDMLKDMISKFRLG
ncbi:MAG: methyl-accepting chemotaxis protein [Oscillospiraceae bacterium]|nr:methyl-accepting chemotaxis protein [Oscillospiraceae bacterium]